MSKIGRLSAEQGDGRIRAAGALRDKAREKGTQWTQGVELDGHERWPDDVSLTDSNIFVAERVLTPAQVTDTYLLGLAVRHGGKLATLDRRLSPLAVLGGADALLVI